MTDTQEQFPDMPSHLHEYGQNYLQDVVQTWQILRQRNIENASRSQNLDTAVVTTFKRVSKSTTDHETFVSLLDTMIPSLISQIADINSQLTTLFSDITEVENDRNEYVQAKNQQLISAHVQTKRTEFETFDTKLKSEYALHEKWVIAQRNKQLTKAVEQYKIDLEKAYEEKLKQVILQSNMPTLPQPQPLTSTTTTTTTTPIFSLNKTQNVYEPSKVTQLFSSEFPSTSYSYGTMSSSSTNLLRGASFSTQGSQKSLGTNENVELEHDVQKKRQTAIDILEMYANGTTFDDDDYIQ